MTAKKRAIVIAVCVAVAAGGTVAGYYVNKAYRDSNTVADVIPVSMISQYDYASNMTVEGTVVSANSQKVQQNESQLIKEIYVKEGDIIKSGDLILQYDTTKTELDVAQKKEELALIDDKIGQAEKEIKRLRNLRTSEEIPVVTQPPTQPPTEPPHITINTVETIKDTTNTTQGSGSQADPYRFLCTSATVVTNEFMNYLFQTKTFAEFWVYENDEPMYKWTLDGSQLTAETAVQWVVGANVATDFEGNLSVNFSNQRFGTFAVLPHEEIAYDEWESDYYEPAQPVIKKNDNDDYEYSKSEIAQMVSDKQNEIKELEIDKKSADVELRKAESRNEDGKLYSRVDGIVTKVSTGIAEESSEEAEVQEGMEQQPSDDDAIIVINGSGGLSVQAAIGEYDINSVAVGQNVRVMSYESGMEVDAVIKSIEDEPVQNYMSMNNPNQSGYNFIAEITDDSAEGFNADSYVQVTLGDSIGTGTNGNFYIPKHMIKVENGHSYVLAADKNMQLVKKTVKTGAVMYGRMIEIKSGITEEDKICFPYGKNIKEGIKCNESDSVESFMPSMQY